MLNVFYINDTVPPSVQNTGQGTISNMLATKGKVINDSNNASNND